MRQDRLESWRWVSASIVGMVMLASAGGLAPAVGDEPRTLCGKTVDEWIDLLHDRRGDDRLRAISALGHFGPDARAAVPDLVHLLREDHDARSLSRHLVIEALARIGPAAAPAVGLLADELRKEKCFHATGGTFLEAFPGSKDALARIGDASVPALVKALEDPDSDRRCCAAEALGEIGPPARAAVPALIRALRWQQPPPDIRDSRAGALQRQAVIALGKIGPAAAAARPALNALLDGADRNPFLEDLVVIIALGQIGAPPVARLVDAFPREGVGYELACLKAGARDAIPTLRRGLSSDLSCIRIDAALALSAIDPSATDAIPILIETLDRHWDEAFLAPGVLARFGPAARAAIPSLLAQMTPVASDPNSIRALVQIDPEGRHCVAGLIAALKQKEPHVVYTAAEGLGLLGGKARAAVPALAAVVASDVGDSINGCSPRSSAINALVRIDPESPLVVPALVGALRCQQIAGLPEGEKIDDWPTVEAAAKQLGNLGPRARAAVPALLDVLRKRQQNDLPYTTIDAAALALGSIGPDAREAVPTLQAMAEEDKRYSAFSLAALVRLAPEGRELAERWLQRPSAGFARSMRFRDEVECRAVLLGMMGRPSLEADAIIRDELERLDRTLEGADDEDYDEFPEWMIKHLGRFGVGSRRAIPRLYQLRRHRDPWIRLWAGETLTDMMRFGAEP